MLLTLRLFIGHFITGLAGVCLLLIAASITIDNCFCLSSLILSSDDYFVSPSPAFIPYNLFSLSLMAIFFAWPSLIYTIMIEKLNRKYSTKVILISGSVFCFITALVIISMYISSQQDKIQLRHLILIFFSGVIGLLVSILLRYLYLKDQKYKYSPG